MTNRFEIMGDATAIFLNKKDGSVIETFIDTRDLELVKSFEGTWYCMKHETGYIFVVGEDKEKRFVRLHRFIMNAPKGYVVDHIDHDTFNNRRNNLRIVTRGQNNQNRKGATCRSKSGIRGVCWNKEKSKWEVNASVDRKNKHIGYFDSIELAERSAIEYRSKFMPYSSDAIGRS